MYLITNQQVANTKNTISLTKYNKFQINSAISKKTKQAIKTYDKQKIKKNLKFLKIYQSNTFYLQKYKIFFQQLSLNTNIINFRDMIPYLMYTYLSGMHILEKALSPKELYDLDNGIISKLYLADIMVYDKTVTIII